MSEYRTEQKELIRWGTFGQLSVIGVLVTVTIMDKSHLTKVNKTGPNTEPWGTPYTRGREADTTPSTMTD